MIHRSHPSAYVSVSTNRYRRLLSALTSLKALIVGITNGALLSGVLSFPAFAAAQEHTKRLALPPAVTAAMRNANLPDTALGVVVVRLSDNAMVVSHNANISFAPASTMKLVPTFIGLDRLGPIHRGTVEMRTNAQRAGGVLKGDLVLRGVADMDFDTEAFQKMLQTLRDQGIQTIDGNLLVDRHYYQPSRLDIGVPPFDESPEFRYNVIPDALNLNLNLLQLKMESDETGMRIRVTPALDRVTVVSNMVFIDADCKDWEDGWLIPTQTRTNLGGIEVQLQGTFPKNCSANTGINIIDRTEYVARLFKLLWAKLGGSFSGTVIESNAPMVQGELLAEHRSRPLGELVRDINKPSDNTFARMLYLNLGVNAIALSAIDKNSSETPSSAAEHTPPPQGERQRNAAPTLVFAEREVRDWFSLGVYAQRERQAGRQPGRADRGSVGGVARPGTVASAVSHADRAAGQAGGLH